MNGAESLVKTAVDAGVEVCFANPGTTEMPIVAALDAVPGIRAVLGLFEGVCTGAADGYARMSGKPALTLLHLGPGFANGAANLHNARRAHSPIVNLVGDQATWHLAADAPLTSDIASLASPVSAWVRSSESASGLAADFSDAVAAAIAAPGGVATLIIPHDAQWDSVDSAADQGRSGGAGSRRDTGSLSGSGTAAAGSLSVRGAAPDAERVRAVAAALRGPGDSVIFIGASALSARGQRAAARVRAATGCRVIHEIFPARIERGRGLPIIERIPYFPEQVLATLEGVKNLVLTGVKAPVSFFAYQGMPSLLVPEGAETIELASAAHDVAAALEALADELDAPVEFETAAAAGTSLPTGGLNADSMGLALAMLLPEGAVVMDEGATSSLSFSAYSQNSAPHSLLTLTGGALGQGLPCAVGAAIACPERQVIALQADGSSMYTLQSLWTMAREGLDVTVVICANRCYRILQYELARAGIMEPGPRARALTDLSSPSLDWAKIAQGLGVPAASVDAAETFTAELGRALAAPGPHLIEALL